MKLLNFIFINKLLAQSNLFKDAYGIKLRLHWWLFQAAAMQFTLHCKRARNCTVWHVEFFMQSLCNAKKICKANCKCLQQNQFKLILLQALAIFSRNFFFSLKIERFDVLFSNIYCTPFFMWLHYNNFQAAAMQ